jgi:hypothetical protein
MPQAPDTFSVQKVCRILRALSVPEALRLVDVAAATGLNKATVLRLLESLADEGFIELDEDSKCYLLGSGLTRFGRHEGRMTLDLLSEAAAAAPAGAGLARFGFRDEVYPAARLSNSNLFGSILPVITKSPAGART